MSTGEATVGCLHQREEASAAALACLPEMGPASLVRALRDCAPTEAWERVLSGRVSARAGSRHGPTWAELARRIDPERWWSSHRADGIDVVWFGGPRYPAALAADPAPPGVLFFRGSLDALDRPCVAIVGTRSATPQGTAIAFRMGADLAAAGVAVVSGLALGIDGAAHGGVIEAVRSVPGAVPPVGVAASGVDVPYPPRHRTLWEEVCRTGLLLSETPPGRAAQAWRFPARNRIIAGLADVVVVVESHASGGSLITADAALERGKELRVVPGPVGSPASAGTNQLLYDGPGPVRDAQDVLDILGIVRLGAPAPPLPRPDGGRPVGRVRFDPGAEAVLAALGTGPVTVGQLVERTGLTPGRVLAGLDGLAAAGAARRSGGWWFAVR